MPQSEVCCLTSQVLRSTAWGRSVLTSLERCGDIEILIIDLVQLSVNLIIFSEYESIAVRKKTIFDIVKPNIVRHFI